MSGEVQVRHVLGRQLRRLRDRPARDQGEDRRGRRHLRGRLLAGRDRLQVQGPRGLRRRLHRRLPVQRLHPQQRERAHRQGAARQEQGPRRLRRLRRHGRHPRPRQRRRRGRDQEARLHRRALDRQPRRHLPAGALHGAGGRARAAAPVRHRQDARPDGGRRLLRARLRPRGAPDRGGARRRDGRAQGRGRAPAQGRHGRRLPQDLLRRVRAGQGGEEGPRVQAHLGVPPGSGEVPARAGPRVHGPRHARRLRGPLHGRRHAVPRLLRRPRRRRRPGREDAQHRRRRSSTRRPPRRSPRSPRPSPTRWARSTASVFPVRCCGAQAQRPR